VNIGDDRGPSVGRVWFGRQLGSLCPVLLLFAIAALTANAQTFTSV